VVLEGLRGEPVICEQFRMQSMQRIEQVDGVIAFAELIPLHAE
jgi:hypothetical protein